MTIPGFTAEATLRRSDRNYNAKAVAHNALRSSTLTLALDDNPKLGYVDCKEFPNGSFCRECGATGPDSAICCPNNYCIINNPPEERGRNWGLRNVLGIRGLKTLVRR
ncbi:MAG TPA: hypothetical protein VEW46_16390 [Pyrinomonadaceae bacterium]|nr:hypothetical protein [Pyrinomonadaceae bacterium]